MHKQKYRLSSGKDGTRIYCSGGEMTDRKQRTRRSVWLSPTHDQGHALGNGVKRLGPRLPVLQTSCVTLGIHGPLWGSVNSIK